MISQPGKASKRLYPLSAFPSPCPMHIYWSLFTFCSCLVLVIKHKPLEALFKILLSKYLIELKITSHHINDSNSRMLPFFFFFSKESNGFSTYQVRILKDRESFILQSQIYLVIKTQRHKSTAYSNKRHPKKKRLTNQYSN